MERTEFSIHIDASCETIWEVLFSDASYPQWTSVFGEGSRAETDWKQGSEVRFLGGEGDGLIGIIEVNEACSYMSIRYTGMVRNGKAEIGGPEMEAWGEATENYSLTNEGEGTRLTVDMHIPEAYKDYFLGTWPKALAKVKEIAEGEDSGVKM